MHNTSVATHNDAKAHPLLGKAAFLPATHLCWYVTERCNYACKFCYRYQEGEEGLSLGQARSIMRKLRSLGVSKITFTGEPLLVKWIYDAIEYAYSLGMYTTLMTNGSLFNSTKESTLRRSLNRLSLPLDGSNEDMNLRMTRAPGHYARVVRLARLLETSPIHLKITTVLTRVNAPDIASIADRVRELHAREWKVFQFRSNRGDAVTYADSFRIDDGVFSHSIGLAAERTAHSELRFSYVSLSDEFTDFFLMRPNGTLELATGKGYVTLGDLKSQREEDILASYGAHLQAHDSLMRVAE